MNKKLIKFLSLIFLTFFALIFFITPTQAAKTSLVNCASTQIAFGQTATEACFYQTKQVAYPLNCSPTDLPSNETCCCSQKIEYTCTWKTQTTRTNPNVRITSVDGGCSSSESPGSDCDPIQKPSSSDGINSYTKVACCCPGGVAATKKADFIIPQLSVNIDTVKLSQNVYCTGEDGSGECQIPWIAEYINGVYQYGFGIGGILAAIMLMAGGLIWLVSAGDASKITQAKDLILGSIVGLMILSTSYLILTMINPDLINMKPLKIGQIEKVEPIIDGSDSDSNAADTCINEAELKNISNLVTTSAQTPSLSSDAYIGLEKAIEEAKKQGVELYITSAFRTDAHQQQLWEDALAKHGDPDTAARYVARPGSCGGHRNGSAIDVCIKSGSSCGKINADNAEASDSDILKLQDIMKKAGWLRYCGEWWHFQYNDTPKKSCSP